MDNPIESSRDIGERVAGEEREVGASVLDGPMGDDAIAGVSRDGERQYCEEDERRVERAFLELEGNNELFDVLSGYRMSGFIGKNPDFGENVFHSIHRIGNYAGSDEQLRLLGQRCIRDGGSSITFLVAAIHGDHIHVVHGTRASGECRSFGRLLRFFGRPVSITKESSKAFYAARFKRLWSYLATGEGR